MVRLEHVFAAGLRFDTEIEYLAQTARGLRYHKLPVLKTGSDHAGAWASALQCVLLLGQTHSGRVTPEHRRVALKALGEAPQPGAPSIMRCIRILGNRLEADRLEVASTVKAPDMGQTALQALRSGGVCLLHYESSRDIRWATVTGVEQAVDGNKVSARALLLLDSKASEPWACAHNVRIEIKPVRRRSDSESTALDYPLVCRHLTGQASRVRLLSLISLKRPDHACAGGPSAF